MTTREQRMKNCSPALALALIAIWLVPTHPITAKTTANHASQSLQIRIRAGDIRGGIPTKFTLTIINKSDHDLVIPEPTVDCGDLFRGTVSVEVDFTPRHPSPESIGHGHGCGKGISDWPTILDRIKEWRTLRPGESLVVEESSTNWLFDFDQPGRYKVWGQYEPPEVSPRDREVLRRSGIDFPQVKIISHSLLFNKTH